MRKSRKLKKNKYFQIYPVQYTEPRIKTNQHGKVTSRHKVNICRYYIVNMETGEVVSDAHGCGFRTPERAYNDWKCTGKKMEAEARQERIKKRIDKFFQIGPGLWKDLMDKINDIQKGYCPESEWNEYFVRKTMQIHGVLTSAPFSAKDIIDYFGEVHETCHEDPKVQAMLQSLYQSYYRSLTAALHNLQATRQAQQEQQVVKKENMKGE